jgi:hypothetical protein
LVRIERIEGSSQIIRLTPSFLHSLSKPLLAGWKSSARISFSASSTF